MISTHNEKNPCRTLLYHVAIKCITTVDQLMTELQMVGLNAYGDENARQLTFLDNISCPKYP